MCLLYFLTSTKNAKSMYSTVNVSRVHAQKGEHVSEIKLKKRGIRMSYAHYFQTSWSARLESYIVRFAALLSQN